jgi:hypothetical protein
MYPLYYGRCGMDRAERLLFLGPLQSMRTAQESTVNRTPAPRLALIEPNTAALQLLDCNLYIASAVGRIVNGLTNSVFDATTSIRDRR